MAKKMKNGTFDWDAAGPIQIVEREGRRIIVDGHHRAAAAMRAGMSDVPVQRIEVSDAVWETMVRQSFEAMGR